MVSKEILTLQFGHYSNFIGSHWWNIQEFGFDYNGDVVPEIDHDVLYREGVTDKGQVTYAPRLLLVDLKGSLNNLPLEGELYNSQADPEQVKRSIHWDAVDIKHEKAFPKNEFQEHLSTGSSSDNLTKRCKLDDSINVWSDFLYSRFHPATVNVINQYQHNNENVPFDIFSLGNSLWKTDKFVDFADSIRKFVEECDHLQGFHMITDCTNAFSGLSSACLEYVKDEYERKSVLVFPVIPSHYEEETTETNEAKMQSSQNDVLRLLNLTFSFNEYRKYSSMFVPLCTSRDGWPKPGAPRRFYHTQYNANLLYHTSAILASALDTVTLKYRQKSRNSSLMDMCSDLTRYGRKVSAASLCFPFSLNIDSDFLECLDNWEGQLVQSITPR
ncbi:protein misato homolog 1 isoform X2 [Cylas formicarius]|nr:protein misato homolog 1 isoform X2 [Cylas formicarius]